jgi:hypothetical protein
MHVFTSKADLEPMTFSDSAGGVKTNSDKVGTSVRAKCSLRPGD